MSASRHTLPDHDLDLLSAYLDGQLSAQDRQSLEARLAQDATLRTALQELRDTVALVRGLPRVRAPRNFTLDPAIYGNQRAWWKRWRLPGFETLLQLSGAVGAAASIALIALAFLTGTSDRAGNAASRAETTAAEPAGADIEPATVVAMQFASSATIQPGTTIEEGAVQAEDETFQQAPETEWSGVAEAPAPMAPTYAPQAAEAVQDSAQPEAQSFAAPSPQPAPALTATHEIEPEPAIGEAAGIVEEAVSAPAAPPQETLRDQPEQPPAAGAAQPMSEKSPTKTPAASPTTVPTLGAVATAPSAVPLTAVANALEMVPEQAQAPAVDGLSDECNGVARESAAHSASEEKQPGWLLIVGIALLAFSAGLWIIGRLKASRR